METEEQKKNKMKNIFLCAGLVALIAFVIITAIVLNSKNKQLKQLEEDYDRIKPSEEIVRILD